MLSVLMPGGCAGDTTIPAPPSGHHRVPERGPGREPDHLPVGHSKKAGPAADVAGRARLLSRSDGGVLELVPVDVLGPAEDPAELGRADPLGLRQVQQVRQGVLDVLLLDLRGAEPGLQVLLGAHRTPNRRLHVPGGRLVVDIWGNHDTWATNFEGVPE